MAIEIPSTAKLSEASKALLDSLSETNIPEIESIQGVFGDNLRLSAELKRAESDLKAIGNAKRELESSNSKLDAEKRQLTSMREEALKRSDLLEEEIAEKDKQISDLSKKCNILSTSSDELRNRVKDLEDHLTDPSMRELYQIITTVLPVSRKQTTSNPGSRMDIEIIIKQAEGTTQLLLRGLNAECKTAAIQFTDNKGNSSKWTPIS